jgi:hypothetical protein
MGMFVVWSVNVNVTFDHVSALAELQMPIQV